MKTQILTPEKENIRKCADIIRSGGIVAFPTETVYGLGASAFDEKAVNAVFEAKGRPSDNPLIVHVATFDRISDVAEMNPLAEKLATHFMPGPITLVLKKKPAVPDCVTAKLPTVGVRMPSHPVCREFLAACGVPVAAPSANASTRPSPTCAEHVLGDLDGKIEYILDGGKCSVGLESTIVDVSGDKPKLLRAGGVPAEELRKVCGCEIETVANSSVALCPGMKYKHYSPKAEVYFSAYYAGMTGGICGFYDRLKDAGKRTVILALSANASSYGNRDLFDLGADYESYARGVFASLRRADAENYDCVIAEGVPSEGIGAAIINRLIKSSGGKII